MWEEERHKGRSDRMQKCGYTRNAAGLELLALHVPLSFCPREWVKWLSPALKQI